MRPLLLTLLPSYRRSDDFHYPGYSPFIYSTPPRFALLTYLLTRPFPRQISILSFSAKLPETKAFAAIVSNLTVAASFELTISDSANMLASYKYGGVSFTSTLN